MGQRLNIEIHNDGEPLANAYYHWSAYTTSAMYLSEIIIDEYNELVNIGRKIDHSMAIELLEATGAQVTPEELEHAQKAAPNRTYNTGASRTDGLIAVSEKGMAETRFYEEGRVVIDISTGCVEFDVWITYEIGEYEEHYNDGYFNTPVEDLAEWGHDVTPHHVISFDDFLSAKEEVVRLVKDGQYTVVVKNPEGCDPVILNFIA